MSTPTPQAIAQAAAALIVEEGMEIGPAKRQALKQLGLRPQTPLPDNRTVEDAVREHIQIFRAQEQPQELRALREIALQWMDRLAEFSPLIGGALWNGTATRHSTIHLQLFHDDPKALPITLLNQGLSFETEEAPGLGGQATEVLILEHPTREPCLDGSALIALWNNPAQALRGALLPDKDGRAPRGTAQSLRDNMAAEEAP
ncbi:hypothetical protein EBQ26_05085 [Allofranklinella schreckenbergeri]|uniref:UDP-N-acetylmuramate--alanine ligase n=1 Tax=Allofranklinella schreckenbergeri TaxID=1076744 RepID=A0A3M6Q7N5_9BURK|nr:hypothetical protein [Allofranklinella schreckenbergeri]RMW99167.1 hypothetical protein EBQ26_05085 [Allofranklinella schreckenbergeri]RRD41771.1 hypothetical protein EII18_07770 [Comamonadaceae bacterium OH3737_COT-264]